MKFFRLLIVFSSVFAVEAQAQTPDSVIGAGTKKFKTGGGRYFWMGRNYRQEWNTPVNAQPINLSSERGGLTPVKRGGGKQTKSLRLEDPQGRQYNLRSIQKFITSKTLPADLQSEAAADLVADGVSASYPYSALSVTPLAEAAGVPHVNPKLVYVPDDPKLGEYRADFGNMLAFFEERLPDSVKKGYDSDEVAEKLKEDNDDRVDQLGLLKARALDMFIMDFDRHEDQWSWGAYDNANGKGKTYYAIARDRDQAFYINQGLLPGIVKWPWLVPQVQGFRKKAKNINRFNFAARNLDRFFLNELTEADWKRVTEQFIATMTDDVLQKAIDAQPAELRSISGPEILEILKARRTQLMDEMMQYYRFISEKVSVTASDKTEFFDITRNDDGSADLTVFKVNKEGEQSKVMYQRKFDGQVTKEIMLYGFGGDDKFTVKGSNDKIRIRLIGGDGTDVFENTGSSRGGIVYDEKKADNKIEGSFRDKRSNDTIVNSYDRLGYKYNQTIPFLAVGFNQDDGLFLGASLKLIRHGFRKTPYKSMNQFIINHALATKAFNFRWYAEHIGVFGRTGDLLTDIDIKAPNNTTNFFGYGNSTVYDKSQPGRFRYYRARYSLGDISVLLRKNFSSKVFMTVGPTFQFYDMDPTDKLNATRYITQTGLNGLDPATLFEKQSYLGGKFQLSIDTRNRVGMPTTGINWQTSVRYLSGQNGASYNSVTQVNSDFTFYLSLVKNAFIIANRVGGGHNFGDFEFYQAQYLGSEDNLRGFRKYRFAGQSKFYNNLEARVRLAKFRTYLFPGSLGILAFYDAGRVWHDTDPSTKWQSGYGAGFWIAPLNRLVLTFTYSASKEDKIPLLSLGWKF